MLQAERSRTKSGAPDASGGSPIAGDGANPLPDSPLPPCPLDATPLALRRILYVSSACPGMGDEGDWQALLPTWRQRNRRDDITSVLLHDQGSLMQLLEGPESHVTRLFDNIRRDPRHSGLVVLVAEAAVHRLLPGSALVAARRGGELVPVVLKPASTTAGSQTPAEARAVVNCATARNATDDALWAAIQSFGSGRHGRVTWR